MHRLIAALTVFGGLALSATAHATSTFNFTLAGTGGSASSGFFSGSGSFIADPTGSMGAFLISDLTGTDITSFIQPGGFNNNDDLVYPSAANLLDTSGFAFTYQNITGVYSADVYETSNGDAFAYVEDGDGDTVTVPVTFSIDSAVTPEPSSIVLLATGLLGLVVLLRRQSLPV